jgi:hypothetical protein
MALVATLVAVVTVIVTWPVPNWTGRVVFGGQAALWLCWAWRVATARIEVGESEVALRGVLRTVRFPIADAVGWRMTPWNRSFMLTVLLREGSTVRVPMVMQGSANQVKALQIDLQRLGIAPPLN